MGTKQKRERKRKEYQDDGLINDNESDAETGASLKKRRKKKGEGRKRKSGADAPVLESSDDERRPSKPNPKHKSQEFIQDSDFKAKDDTKKLASSDDESGDENKVSSSNIEK